MTKHKQTNKWLIIVSTVFLGMGVLCLTGFIGYYLLSADNKNAEKVLFPHVVNDISNKNSVWLFIVADNNITKEDAMNIINFYSKKYYSEKILNIEIHCDYKYANQKYVFDPAYLGTISDEEYYSQVMYKYLRGENESFRSREEFPEIYGTACK